MLYVFQGDQCSGLLSHAKQASSYVWIIEYEDKASSTELFSECEEGLRLSEVLEQEAIMNDQGMFERVRERHRLLHNSFGD